MRVSKGGEKVRIKRWGSIEERESIGETILWALFSSKEINLCFPSCTLLTNCQVLQLASERASETLLGLKNEYMARA